MNVIAQGFPGLIRVCEQCNSVLGYAAKDIYERKYLYCAVCKHKNEVPEIIDAQIVEVKKMAKLKVSFRGEPYCSECRMIQRYNSAYCSFCGACFANYEEIVTNEYMEDIKENVEKK